MSTCHDARTGGYAMRALTAAILLGAALAAGAAGPAPADSGLKAAREELRLRIETERRMREQFESLLAGGRMSAEEIADFESYLRRLGGLVGAQRRAVAKLEGGGAGAVAATGLPTGFDRGQTDEEKLAMLDAELGSSLSEFDEKLLREQKKIAEKSRSASADGGGSVGHGGSPGGSAKGDVGGAEGANQASGSPGERQAGDGDAASGSGDQTVVRDGQETGAEAPTESRRKGAEGDDRVASAGGENTGTGAGRASPPPDIPDGKDDDIVARQLREAAETEADPELREKLWDEYRKYKQGTR